MKAPADAPTFFRPKSLVDYIVESLEQDILNGVLRPGERIIEAAVCDKLGVSRSPLREAFRILANQGFVVHQPRKGVSVARLSLKEAEDIYAIRANLESLATGLAVQKQDPAVLARLKAIHLQIVAAAKENDFQAFYSFNQQFHRTFIDAGGNQRLRDMIEQFEKQTKRYRVEVLSIEGRMQESIQKHAELIASFEAGNAMAAEILRKESILSNIPLLREKLKEEREADEDRS